jgi:Putative bacterial sensory transduction regulator
MSSDAPSPPGPPTPPSDPPTGGASTDGATTDGASPGGPPTLEEPRPEEPNPHVLLLKDKVQRYLADMVGAVQLTPDGAYSFQAGSAQVFVRCMQWGTGDRTLVSIVCPVLFAAAPSPELYEHIAVHADDYLFGHLSAANQDDGTVSVFFTHTLLGDYLDPEELKQAVGAVVTTANTLDDELKTRFGGSRFHEDGA